MLPRAWYQLYTGAAEWAARTGAVVASGATPGAEQLALQCALAAGGTVRLYLPWSGFEAEWVRNTERAYPGKVTTSIYDPNIHGAWTEAIHRTHPAGTHLAKAALALYARSYGAVYEATSVVALPFVRSRNGATDKGQSEQGLQLARELGLSLYDLSEEDQRQQLRALLET
jgi:hypothetical protein